MSSEARQLLIGIHPVSSALQASPQSVTGLWIAAECRNSRVAELEKTARAAAVTVERHPRHDLDRACDQQRHQDVIAWFRPDNIHGEADVPALLEAVEGPPLVLVLDGIQDPHNLGACLRSADAAGVNFVVLPRDRASGITPVVRRAAAGAAETLGLVMVPNLARVLRQLKDAGIWLVGTSDRGDESLYRMDLNGPLALVMGAEGKGLRRLTASHCDHLVSIPMSGSVDSLNVSVATAVCLFEAVRQRDTGRP
ncbi:23S rRNA (guanosine(2251)-2'-O)-methyltransferase RlmB [Elongatibacter sediminis]|uniref:23S rRNA (guanosine-2'-O-)-methyltransferase RlmB n=1 Tax=Elongatibacter sediminis TaxID=3119006 RepID=A0AAW9R8G2_9GAMM